MAVEMLIPIWPNSKNLETTRTYGTKECSAIIILYGTALLFFKTSAIIEGPWLEYVTSEKKLSLRVTPCPETFIFEKDFKMNNGYG